MEEKRRKVLRMTKKRTIRKQNNKQMSLPPLLVIRKGKVEMFE